MVLQKTWAITGVLGALALGTMALAAPKHGISMYGEPALPPDFVSLPYANPDAPKGGKAVFGEVGSFDSLNPHIRKGTVPWQLRFVAYEGLLGRSWDEPFSLYGLLAESVDADSEGLWVEFHLNPAAKFSDGSPVTVEDVIWSYETLGTEGHPRYAGAWSKVAQIEATGPRSIRLTLKEPNRELLMILGLRPVLKKAQWDGRDFSASGLEPPIATAPYVISDSEAGRFVELSRDVDYWGNDLPFRRGTNNLDTIRMEFFGDGTVMMEAFRSGELSALRESNARKWAENFDFPAVQSGDIVKSEIPHQRPSGMTGFVFNTRNPLFADWRVREALILAFNYEMVAQTINAGGAPRISSYFSNSVLGMRPGPAEGRVRELLEPFAADLPPGVLEGYVLPQGSASARNRGDLRRATALMEEAGWTVKDGALVNSDGTPFAFTILLQNGSSENEAIANLYVQSLKRLGVAADISRVDKATYKERTDAYEFDVTRFRRGLSLSPGNEQRRNWGSAGVTAPGSRNLMGMDVPAAEAMIDAMLSAETQADYVAAVRALDRVLMAGRYAVPFWHNPVSFLAHKKELHYSERLPAYGDWIGFLPDVWWVEE